jgi:hypothetical protein
LGGCGCSNAVDGPAGVDEVRRAASPIKLFGKAALLVFNMTERTFKKQLGGLNNELLTLTLWNS